MSDSKHCETCRFWQHDRHSVGQCRFNAPQRGGVSGTEAAWPFATSHDWCGQWAPHGSAGLKQQALEQLSRLDWGEQPDAAGLITIRTALEALPDD